ncbi:RagB/SusD family nutrient uptake outer membrane protein [Rubrivirga sp. IMCC43871]|uniref:RagB/SusD family nutrient uptake outer membrane protein n=1 Tax=Rubrivirga sp. IMCC43871 TaxID=3391575 RepID=UPI0039901BB8
MNTNSTRGRVALLAAVLVPVLGLGACTDLSVDPFSSVTPENFYQNDTEVIAALSPVYSQLRGTLWAYHNLSQVTSDETIVPTRGNDWFDGGDWLSLHQHSWTPTLGFLNDAWNTSYSGIARANSLLRDLESIENVPNREGLIAEIRGLRGFYYYTLLDLFGNIPLIGDEEGEFSVDPDNPPQTETRATVFAFVVSEFEDIRSDLPVAGAGNGGRFSQGAADAILASLYLNAEVFGGTVTAGGLQRGPARYQDALDAATRVISGPYSLNQGIDAWQDQFSPTNQDDPEHIFVVQHLNEDGYGVNFPFRALHYNSFAGGGWNGFSTIAETYAKFDTDPRRVIFAEGQAINYDTGEPITDRNGDPLVFTPDFPNGVTPAGGGAGEGDGIRVLKFPVDVDRVGSNGNNDYPYFRLGEMYLIRAEALFRTGNTAGALADINAIRTRVGATPLASVSLDDILEERLLELTYEARRRQDLIRFDQFVTGDWSFKNGSAPFRVLFAIPQTQIDASDGVLQQNPGY